MFTPPTRNYNFFYKLLRVSAIRHTFFLAFRCRKTIENAKDICNFSKKVAISFERGDIDVRTSHANPSLFFHFFTCITFWTPFFKANKLIFHRLAKLGPAKKPCKPHDTSLTFEKWYAFRSSVVTSMCAPPTRNHYLFLICSNVSRIWHAFLATIMYGTNGRHRILKSLENL